MYRKDIKHKSVNMLEIPRAGHLPIGRGVVVEGGSPNKQIDKYIKLMQGHVPKTIPSFSQHDPKVIAARSQIDPQTSHPNTANTVSTIS